MKCAILYTPGIDSLMTYKYLTKKGIVKPSDIICVYYDNKCRYSAIELNIVTYLHEFVCQPVNLVIDTTFDFSKCEEPNSTIHQRNGMMALHAASNYSPIVYIGGTKSDRIYDNTKLYFDSVNEMLKMSGSKGEIKSCFWDVDKHVAVKDLVDEKAITEMELLNTFSCYDPVRDYGHPSKGINECLNCPACFRKNVILYHALGICRMFHNLVILDKYKREFSNENLDDPNSRESVTMAYIEHLRKKNGAMR